MSPRALICSVAVVLAVTVLAPAAVGGVIVVALDGSGDTNELGIALDIASAGDVILVKPGTYVDFLSLDPESFHYIDRPITIVGDAADQGARRPGAGSSGREVCCPDRSGRRAVTAGRSRRAGHGRPSSAATWARPR